MGCRSLAGDGLLPADVAQQIVWGGRRGGPGREGRYRHDVVDQKRLDVAVGFQSRPIDEVSQGQRGTLRGILLNRSGMLANVTLDAENWATLRPGLEALLDALPATEVNQRWWKFMSDIMDYDADGTPTTVDLNRVFHLP